MAKAASPAITQALTQLRNAVAALETVSARRSEADRSNRTLKAELAVMQDDRARLALELDVALSKASRLETVTTEVAKRVDRAIGSVRGALEDIDVQD